MLAVAKGKVEFPRKPFSKRFEIQNIISSEWNNEIVVGLNFDKIIPSLTKMLFFQKICVFGVVLVERTKDWSIYYFSTRLNKACFLIWHAGMFSIYTDRDTLANSV